MPRIMVGTCTYFDLIGVIRKCLDEMTERVDGDGGAIAIDPKGTK